MLEAKTIYPNRYLVCAVDDENKTIECVILDEGTAERNIERFCVLMECLGNQYVEYTVICTIPMVNNKIATIKTKIM